MSDLFNVWLLNVVTSTGISSALKIGSPISTTTVDTTPFSTLSFNVLIPESVSILTSVLSVRPKSYTYLPTHLIPLPHILPLEPSALYISIKKSALSELFIRISPSEPIPKCLSLTFIATCSGLSSSFFVQST